MHFKGLMKKFAIAQLALLCFLQACGGGATDKNPGSDQKASESAKLGIRASSEGPKELYLARAESVPGATFTHVFEYDNESFDYLVFTPDRDPQSYSYRSQILKRKNFYETKWSITLPENASIKYVDKKITLITSYRISEVWHQSYETLTAVDSQTGKEIWFKIDRNEKDRGSPISHFNSPHIGGGLVVVKNNKAMTLDSYDLLSGELLRTESIADRQAQTLLITQDQTIVVYLTIQSPSGPQEMIEARKNGQSLWMRPRPNARLSQFRSDAILVDLDKAAPELWSLSTGKTLTTLPKSTGQVTYDQDVAYFADEDASVLRAVRRSDTQILWEKRGFEASSFSMEVVGNSLVVVAPGGNILVLDKNSGDELGKQSVSKTAPGLFFSNPTMINSSHFFTQLEDHLLIWRIR